MQGEQDGGQQRIASAYFKTNGQFVLPKILLQAKNFPFSVIEDIYNKKFGPNCFLASLTMKIN